MSSDAWFGTHIKRRIPVDLFFDDVYLAPLTQEPDCAKTDLDVKINGKTLGLFTDRTPIVHSNTHTHTLTHSHTHTLTHTHTHTYSHTHTHSHKREKERERERYMRCVKK